MSDRTHWPDCWRDPAHHACALDQIARMDDVVRELATTAAMRCGQQAALEQEIARLRSNLKDWIDVLDDAAAERCPDASAVHCGCVGPLRHEIARLRAVLRMTHTQYCTESWTDRGLHAPGCLLYEMEPEE